MQTEFQNFIGKVISTEDALATKFVTPPIPKHLEFIDLKTPNMLTRPMLSFRGLIIY